MKTFKQIDCYIQFGVILLGIVLGVMFVGNIEFLWSYFIVGGWQIISVIVHLFYTAPYRTSMRKVYLIILGIDIITGPYGWIIISPFLAFYYFGLSIVETRELYQQSKLYEK